MNRTRKLLFRLSPLFVLLFAYFACTSGLDAQSNAALDVTVFDPREAVVTDATVVLQGVSSAADELAPASSGDGHYRFDAPPGRYRLSITHQQLQRTERV